MARVVGVLHGGAVGSPDPDQSTVAVIAVLDQSACLEAIFEKRGFAISRSAG
jgi:hypothetical protein